MFTQRIIKTRNKLNELAREGIILNDRVGG